MADLSKALGGWSTDESWAEQARAERSAFLAFVAERTGPDAESDEPTYAQVVGAIKGAFAGAGSWLYSAGVAVVTGFISGITSKIAEEKGNTVRMVESSTENYWYGFSPFTWFITPVITTVAAEYEPAAGAPVPPKK